MPELPQKNVVQLQDFAAQKKISAAKSKNKSATRGKSKSATRGKITVDSVKASKGTWAFRLRWNSAPGRPVHYVSRVSDTVHELIRGGDYEGFKAQLISSHGTGTIRASNRA